LRVNTCYLYSHFFIYGKEKKQTVVWYDAQRHVGISISVSNVELRLI